MTYWRFLLSAEDKLRQSSHPEVDYVFLTSLLNNYARPRQEISRLVQKRALLRVKKGLYVVSGDSAPPYSRHILANLVYGPSYVSLESALSFYGMIPERVVEITSVTCNRDKSFSTPAGEFSYRYLRPAYHFLGVAQEELSDGRHFLIATPEKALVDKLWFSRKEIEPVASDLEAYLFEDLRIEPDVLARLNMRRLAGLIDHYSAPIFAVLLGLLKSRKGNQ